MPSSSALRQYAAREGHARVPQNYVETVDGIDVNLGNWVVSKRGQFKSDRLSAERIAELEALPGWPWQLRSRRA
jgi:hypothetical protein